MFFWVTFLILLFILIASCSHFRSAKNKVKDEEIYIYSEGKTAYFEAILFFKVNTLRNNPRGIWLIFESAWPLLISLFFGIFLLCVYSITIEKRDLTFAALVNNETEGKSENSSNLPECIPLQTVPDPKNSNVARIASSKRNVANVNNLGNTNFNLNKGYLFFLMFWMASITAVFTNYFIKSRFHADKWSLNNKALLDILKEDNIPPFTDPKWKRFAHDLVITGMWGHRSFSKYFHKIVHENWVSQNPGSNFNRTLSERDCLKLLSDV